ncbi:MAG TPA: PP2C family serine/threonine-protein phosphatase [Thermoleophilia bacterium]|nr:PP2C family serine/threonine-protein phosphatase [Thermoleophilia bacterium]
MTLVARYTALSDIGLHRKTNEDAVVVAPPLYAVCDGMGGAQAGEVASALAAETLAAGVADGLSLLAAAEAANAAVFARAQSDSAHAGMGTTLTAVLLDADTGHFVHVGDSRAYLWRDGELTQVSDDHSLVAEMVRGGRLTEEEAAVHPHRSVLSRALGTEATVRLDEFVVDLHAGDVLLLCSDGLSGPVEAPAIARALSLGDVDEAGRTLINEARRQGGPDNITALVLRIEAAPADAPQAAALTVAAALGDDEPGVGRTDPSPNVALPRSEALAVPATGAGRPRRRMVSLVVCLSVLVLVGLVSSMIISTVFYVTVDEGRLAVFSGLPVEVGPVPLHVVYRSSSRLYSSLSDEERAVVDARELRGKDDAMSLGRDLEMWP